MSQPLSVQGRRLSRVLCLAALAAGISSMPVLGDVVILKDGYTIHGKLITQQSSFFDNLTGELIVTKKMNGLTMVDDGVRLTAFSASYKRVGDVDPFDKFVDMVQIKNPLLPGFRKYPLPPFLRLVKDDGFKFYNKKWQQQFKFVNPPQPEHPYQITLQIDLITPYFVHMNSTTHNWQVCYLTKEIGPEKIRKLLALHDDFSGKNANDPGKRAILIRFLIQADWLNEADEEIERMLKDLPGETKRAEEFRDTIRDLRIEKAVADIERAKESGQHNFARQALETLSKEKLSAKIRIKVAGLKAEYKALTEKFEKARRYLKEVPEQVKGPQFKDLIEGAETIARELQLDVVDRLDSFIALAEQAEAARKANRAPQKPEELLALAITGWLMGKNSAETSVVVARKYLDARQKSLAYLREENSGKRRDLILTYFRSTEALPFDELEKLISLLPPPEAEKDISTSPQSLTTPRLPFLDGGASYLLKLPPEYQHTRPYPMLVVLPNAGEKPSETLQRLGDWPSRYGFIVAVIDWAPAFGAAYNYTDEEQYLVTGAIRHLRRTLQVDSDRVFLLGNGEGANFAFDLGATHPDLFAGIIPMNPAPSSKLFRVFEYWKNFQNLPVYMIVGDATGRAVDIIRDILTAWMPKGYPALAVSYKGRGFEWFTEEMPFLFDWMTRKTRSQAFPDLGRNEEQYRTIRASSNRFYWIGADEIDKGHLFDPQGRNTFYAPTIQAHFSEGNVVSVEAMFIKRISIHLGKGTVDFGKPVVVSIRDRGVRWSKLLSPKIDVLLEDLYERGDRQRPIYQRIDCTINGGLSKMEAR